MINPLTPERHSIINGPFDPPSWIIIQRLGRAPELALSSAINPARASRRVIVRDCDSSVPNTDTFSVHLQFINVTCSRTLRLPTIFYCCFFFSLYIFFLPHEEINYANSWAWLCVQVDAWRRKIEVTVQRRIYRGTYRESDLARALSTRPEPRTLGARVFSCETQVGRGGRIDAHSIRGKVPRTSLHLRSQRSAVTQRRCYWTRGKLLASAVLSRQGSSVHPVNRGSDDKVGEKNLAKNWFFFLIRSGWEDCQIIKKLLIFNDLYTSRITARKKFIRIEGNFVCFYFS